MKTTHHQQRISGYLKHPFDQTHLLSPEQTAMVRIRGQDLSKFVEIKRTVPFEKIGRLGTSRLLRTIEDENRQGWFLFVNESVKSGCYRLDSLDDINWLFDFDFDHAGVLSIKSGSKAFVILIDYGDEGYGREADISVRINLESGLSDKDRLEIFRALTEL
ncbi:MAG: hypothetical protein PW843_15295 [Azospirillaceae bacterium]|nr:hypothetical protein [Azospirillaceae bacterium]